MEFNMKKVRVGMEVEGKVFMVTDDSVHVDLGSHAEGVIYKKGLSLEEIKSCKELVKEGDVITAKVTRMDDENQQVLLSRLDLLKDEKRESFNKFIDDAEVFKAKVTGVNKGGLELSAQGTRMFMPMSHIDTRRVDAENFLGQTLEVTLLERKGSKVVVSRRNVLRKQEKLAQKEAFDAINVGDVVTGKVASIMKFGAFVQLNNIQGLVHISELSHHRITNVEDVVKTGDEVEVKVISKNKGKIGLSMKALQKTPWQIYAETHKPGDEVQGKIVRKMATGMLVEVSKDVVGIINKNDYSWDPKENFAGEVEVGQEVTLKIVSMDVKKRRMSLSKKHLEYNPWKDVSVKEGEEVSGTVTELQSRGAIVNVQGVNAFLPIGEIKQERVNEIAQVLKVEDVIKAVVTKLDKEDWNMVISIKQLEETKQRAEFEDYLETEEEVSNPTLGDLFKDELEKFKK